MEDFKIYTFNIKPQGKDRPRFSGHMYTTQKTRDFENQIKWLARELGLRCFDGELSVEVVFIYKYIKSIEKRLKNDPDKVVYKSSRPDIDNLVKSFLDALNGIAYKDDSQVVKLSVSKIYGLYDQIILKVKNID